MKARILNAAQAQCLSREAIEEKASIPPDLLLTPPLPACWPVAPGTEIVYLGYRAVDLPTGQIQWEIHFPEAEIRLAPTARDSASVSVHRLASKVLDHTESRQAQQPSSDLDEAASALFRVAAGQGSTEDLRRIRDAHSVWLDEHPVLAEALSERFPEYVGWLLADG